MPAGTSTMDPLREKAFQDYRKKLMEHKEVESRLKDSKIFAYKEKNISAESSHKFYVFCQVFLNFSFILFKITFDPVVV